MHMCLFIHVKVVEAKVLVAQSCPTLVTPGTVARQAPLSMEFFKQEYGSGSPFLFPGKLPDSEIKCVYRERDLL